MSYTDKQKREHVREFQRYLSAISQYDSRIPEIVPDGVFGSATREAVIVFQRTSGLDDNGNVDKPTWDEIVRVYKKLYIRKPMSIRAFPKGEAQLDSNSSRENVMQLQLMLKLISEKYDHFGPVSLDGIYSNKVYSEVARIQRLSGLETNGITDIATWNILAKLFSSVLRGI